MEQNQPSNYRDGRQPWSLKRSRTEKKVHGQPDSKRSHEAPAGRSSDSSTDSKQIITPMPLDKNILNEAGDIYRGITIIEQYEELCWNAIPKHAKLAESLKSQHGLRMEFKQEMHNSYITHLNHTFLEHREEKKGLYPKSGKWHDKPHYDDEIAQFIATGKAANPHLLCTLLLDLIWKPSQNKISRVQHSESMLNLINLLLFYGFNPNLKNSNDRDPLSLVVNYAPLYRIDPIIISALKLLLKYGASPNQKNSTGLTALHLALSPHQINSAKLLLEYGANPNIQDLNGWTALHFVALNHNNPNIIYHLITYGGDPKIQDNNGKNAFDIAHENTFLNFKQLVEMYSSI